MPASSLFNHRREDIMNIRKRKIKPMNIDIRDMRVSFLRAGLFVIALLLAGCNLPASTGTPTPQPIPTILSTPQNTPTAIVPTPTTPIPTVTGQAVVRILFASGATAAVEQGTVQPGQVISYVLGAQANQPMILLLGSTNQDATLAVYEADGTSLLDPAKKWTNFQWLLPRTEDYTIQVIGGAIAENYSLTVKIASRITFASGSTSATVTGSTANGYVISYAIYCNSGQTMTLALTAPANSASLDVFGLAYGQLLLKETAKAASWTGSLPAAQDYIIEIVPKAGQVLSYSLTVSVK